MVLALGAILGNATDADVREALEAVPKKEVIAWIGRSLGPTTTMLRRRLFAVDKP